MLSRDNGILSRAADAKELTDKAQVVEQARIDIMAIIAEKKGEDPTEKEIKDIIEIYFTTVPESLEDLTQDLTTKSGGYNVKLAEVLNGVTIKQEIKENVIAKSTEEADSYVGYYADINNDGKVDGIIYADMIVGNTKSGRWNNGNWSDYNVTKIEDATTVKDYVVSSKTYEGQTTAGIYNYKPKEDAEGFGEKQVLVPATNSTGTKDRFYVMALENFKTTDYETFYWYKSAYGKLNDIIATSAKDFGEGKAKTIKEINSWNATGYGTQDPRDLWGVIQNKIEKKEEGGTVVDCKWFIPSKSEWSAFGEELEITTEGYEKCGLSEWYWSSSQYDTYSAYLARFDYGCIGGDSVNDLGYVRLSATF